MTCRTRGDGRWARNGELTRTSDVLGETKGISIEFRPGGSGMSGRRRRGGRIVGEMMHGQNARCTKLFRSQIIASCVSLFFNSASATTSKCKPSDAVRRNSPRPPSISLEPIISMSPPSFLLQRISSAVRPSSPSCRRSSVASIARRQEFPVSDSRNLMTRASLR